MYPDILKEAQGSNSALCLKNNWKRAEELEIFFFLFLLSSQIVLFSKAGINSKAWIPTGIFTAPVSGNLDDFFAIIFNHSSYKIQLNFKFIKTKKAFYTFLLFKTISKLIVTKAKGLVRLVRLWKSMLLPKVPIHKCWHMILNFIALFERYRRWIRNPDCVDCKQRNEFISNECDDLDFQHF